MQTGSDGWSQSCHIKIANDEEFYSSLSCMYGWVERTMMPHEVSKIITIRHKLPILLWWQRMCFSQRVIRPKYPRRVDAGKAKQSKFEQNTNHSRNVFEFTCAFMSMLPNIFRNLKFTSCSSVFFSASLGILFSHSWDIHQLLFCTEHHRKPKLEKQLIWQCSDCKGCLLKWSSLPWRP